jgi:hypothetical protein
MSDFAPVCYRRYFRFGRFESSDKCIRYANVRPDAYPAQNHSGGPINAEFINKNLGKSGSLDPKFTWEIAIGKRMLQPMPTDLTKLCTTLEYCELIGCHRCLIVHIKNVSHEPAIAQGKSP